MLPDNTFQGCLQQVCCGMIGTGKVSSHRVYLEGYPVINLEHTLCYHPDMQYGIVIFPGILNSKHGALSGVYAAAITYLATGFSVKGGFTGNNDTPRPFFE